MQYSVPQGRKSYIANGERSELALYKAILGLNRETLQKWITFINKFLQRILSIDGFYSLFTAYTARAIY